MHSISSDAGAKDEGKFMDSTENSGFCQERRESLEKGFGFVIGLLSSTSIHFKLIQLKLQSPKYKWTQIR